MLITLRYRRPSEMKARALKTKTDTFLSVSCGRRAEAVCATGRKCH